MDQAIRDPKDIASAPVVESTSFGVRSHTAIFAGLLIHVVLLAIVAWSLLFDGPGAFLLGFAVLAGICGLFELCYVTGYKIEVSNGTVRWKAFYRSRRLPVSQITGSARPTSVSRLRRKILVENQRPMFFNVGGAGWFDFAQKFDEVRGERVFGEDQGRKLPSFFESYYEKA